jgi:hypothetical protein
MQHLMLVQGYPCSNDKHLLAILWVGEVVKGFYRSLNFLRDINRLTYKHSSILFEEVPLKVNLVDQVLSSGKLERVL